MLDIIAPICNFMQQTMFTFGWPMTHLEFIILAINAFGIYLAARNTAWTAPVSLVGIVVFTISCYVSQFYSEFFCRYTSSQQTFGYLSLGVQRTMTASGWPLSGQVPNCQSTSAPFGFWVHTYWVITWMRFSQQQFVVAWPLCLCLHTRRMCTLTRHQLIHSLKHTRSLVRSLR